MQTSVGRPVAPPSARKPSSGGPKGGKKKKAEKKAANGKEQVAGPRPVAPTPASGPWGKPKPAVTSSAPPGFASAAVAAPPATGFSAAHERVMRHRALFALRFLVGKAVEVQLVDAGARFAGVLDCVDPEDFSVVLKGAKRLTEAAEPFEAGSTLVLRRAQLAQLSADGVVDYSDVSLASSSAAGGGFRTDTEISGRQGEHLFGRELQTAASWLDPSLDTGELEDGRRPGKKSGSGSGWNQFEANEKLFGVVSSYDENMYTTKLDKSKISTEQSRAAERLAQEIERQASAGNFHLQEERGQPQSRSGSKHSSQRELDEEARYSSVTRETTAGAKSYVPPALRSGQRPANGSNPKTGVKDPSDKPKSAASATIASAVVPPRAPTKPLSFSDAVLGRSAATTSAPPTSTSPTKPEKAPAVEKDGASPQKASETATTKPSSVKAKAAETEAVTAAASTEKPATERSKPEAKASGKPTAPKKGLNPNAKEFKLSASAAAFTPSFNANAAAPSKSHTASPYRGGPVGYSPGPDDWMYDGGGLEDGEMGIPPHYVQGGGYGMPMYPPMMPQPNVRLMGGQRPHGGGYGGYQQQPYNPQGGYYPPVTGGYVGGGMAYPAGAMPRGVGPQPPLPREPTPGDKSDESAGRAPPTPETAAEGSCATASASASSSKPSAGTEAPKKKKK